MRHVSALALAALLSAPAAAQNESRSPVTITVVDRALQQGIEAEVTVAGADSLTVRAGRDGRAEVRVRAGDYVVRVRAVGYIAASRMISVGAVPGTTVRFSMEPTALPLDAVVVTASRREQRLADAPITTEIVSARDIEVTGAADVASALVEQTGIQLQPGMPSGAGVILQGIGSERVLVLVDGQPLSGRLSGALDLSRLPTSVVDRVEVVKGPQSTLYGSEAMGGVINVVTRRGTLPGLSPRASVRAGTRNRVDASTGADFGIGRFTSSLDVGRRSVENTPGRAGLAGAMTAQLDGALSVGWQASPEATLSASALAIDERQRWRTGSLYQIGDNQQYVGRLSGQFVASRARITPAIGYSLYDHVLYGSAAPAPVRGDTGQRQVQGLALASLALSAPIAGRHQLDAGIEARHESIRAARVIGTRRNSTSLEPFTQLDVAVSDRLTVVPGVRLSWNEEWGTHLTPRVAARYALWPTLTMRLSAASGFRAPDFKELYLSFQNQSAQYAVEGNPLLRPEASRNLSAGLEWATDRVYARTQLFHNALRDFIETRVVSAPGDPLLFRYENVSTGRTHGADSEVGVVWPSVRLEAGYSYLATRDGATGHPLLGRPTHSARLMANAYSKLVRLTVTQLFTGATPLTRDEAGIVTGMRDAFPRTDVRVAFASWRGVEPSLGVDNLFDQRPAMWAAPTERHLYVTLSWAHRPSLR